jgi:hypothetical protein
MHPTDDNPVTRDLQLTASVPATHTLGGLPPTPDYLSSSLKKGSEPSNL